MNPSTDAYPYIRKTSSHLDIEFSVILRDIEIKWRHLTEAIHIKDQQLSNKSNMFTYIYHTRLYTSTILSFIQSTAIQFH